MIGWFKKRSVLSKWNKKKYRIENSKLQIGDYVTSVVPKLMKVSKIEDNIVTCDIINSSDKIRLMKQNVKQVIFE